MAAALTVVLFILLLFNGLILIRINAGAGPVTGPIGKILAMLIFILILIALIWMMIMVLEVGPFMDNL